MTIDRDKILQRITVLRGRTAFEVTPASTADILEGLLKRVESHEVVLRELENAACTGNQTAVTRQPNAEDIRTSLFRDMQKLAREALGPGNLRIEEHVRIDELTAEVERLTAEVSDLNVTIGQLS